MATVTMSYLFPAIFPTYYREDKWTFGKNLINTLLLFLLITLANSIYCIFIFGCAVSWQIFIIMLINVLLIAPFPWVFISLWQRNVLLTKNLKEANLLNQQLTVNTISENKESDCLTEQAHLSFMGNTREALDIPVGDLLYIESEGNYIKVTYLQEDQVHQRMIRNTLKQTEQITQPFNHIIRCHRAFLVNTHQVIKIDGNARGYYLTLRHCTHEVPVSRAYSSILKETIFTK